MDAVHWTAINCLLNFLFRSTFRVMDLGEAIVIHAKHLGDLICTELATDTDILIDIRFSGHDTLSFPNNCH